MKKDPRMSLRAASSNPTPASSWGENIWRLFFLHVRQDLIGHMSQILHLEMWHSSGWVGTGSCKQHLQRLLLHIFKGASPEIEAVLLWAVVSIRFNLTQQTWQLLQPGCVWKKLLSWCVPKGHTSSERAINLLHQSALRCCNCFPTAIMADAFRQCLCSAIVRTEKTTSGKGRSGKVWQL